MKNTYVSVGSSSGLGDEVNGVGTLRACDSCASHSSNVRLVPLKVMEGHVYVYMTIERYEKHLRHVVMEIV